MTDAQLSLGDDSQDSRLRANEAFQQLALEHQALDERLRQLSTLPYLTDQQQFEEIALKKKKLAVKDRMHAIVRTHTVPPGTNGGSAGRDH